jgi:hypothetical protein
LLSEWCKVHQDAHSRSPSRTVSMPPQLNAATLKSETVTKSDLDCMRECRLQLSHTLLTELTSHSAVRTLGHSASAHPPAACCLAERQLFIVIVWDVCSCSVSSLAVKLRLCRPLRHGSAAEPVATCRESTNRYCPQRARAIAKHGYNACGRGDEGLSRCGMVSTLYHCALYAVLAEV